MAGVVIKAGKLVAYKAWKCKFCPEVRQDSGDMWDHLRQAHGIGSVETGSGEMRETSRSVRQIVKEGISAK
jgi:hypothetical protein